MTTAELTLRLNSQKRKRLRYIQMLKDIEEEIRAMEDQLQHLIERGV